MRRGLEAPSGLGELITSLLQDQEAALPFGDPAKAGLISHGKYLPPPAGLAREFAGLHGLRGFILNGDPSDEIDQLVLMHLILLNHNFDFSFTVQRLQKGQYCIDDRYVNIEWLASSESEDMGDVLVYDQHRPCEATSLLLFLQKLALERTYPSVQDPHSCPCLPPSQWSFDLEKEEEEEEADVATLGFINGEQRAKAMRRASDEATQRAAAAHMLKVWARRRGQAQVRVHAQTQAKMQQQQQFSLPTVVVAGARVGFKTPPAHTLSLSRCSTAGRTSAGLSWTASSVGISPMPTPTSQSPSPSSLPPPPLQTCPRQRATVVVQQPEQLPPIVRTLPPQRVRCAQPNSQESDDVKSAKLQKNSGPVQNHHNELDTTAGSDVSVLDMSMEEPSSLCISIRSPDVSLTHAWQHHAGEAPQEQAKEERKHLHRQPEMPELPTIFSAGLPQSSWSWNTAWMTSPNVHGEETALPNHSELIVTLDSKRSSPDDSSKTSEVAVDVDGGVPCSGKVEIDIHEEAIGRANLKVLASSFSAWRAVVGNDASAVETESEVKAKATASFPMPLSMQSMSPGSSTSVYNMSFSSDGVDGAPAFAAEQEASENDNGGQTILQAGTGSSSPTPGTRPESEAEAEAELPGPTLLTSCPVWQQPQIRQVQNMSLTPTISWEIKGQSGSWEPISAFDAELLESGLSLVSASSKLGTASGIVVGLCSRQQQQQQEPEQEQQQQQLDASKISEKLSPKVSEMLRSRRLRRVVKLIASDWPSATVADRRWFHSKTTGY